MIGMEESDSGYHSLQRPCDDPHITFERNRGKWTEKPPVIPRKIIQFSNPNRRSDAVLKASSAANPNNWHKCEHPNCEVLVWKNAKLCRKHRE